MNKTHELKIWPQYFEAVSSGSKTFEYRKNDRDFKSDDTVVLKEWDPSLKEYTSRELTFKIGYVIHIGDPGNDDIGFAVFSLLHQ